MHLSPAAHHLTPNFLHTGEVLLALRLLAERVVSEGDGVLREHAQSALALYEEWRKAGRP